MVQYNVNSSRDNKNNFYKGLVSVGSTVGLYEAEPYIKKYMHKPFVKFNRKQISGFQSGGYEAYIQNVVKQHNLRDLKFININENNIDFVKKKIGYTDIKPTRLQKIIAHLLRKPIKVESLITSTAEGRNAFFIPSQNRIVCNFDKFSVVVFHEIAHKLNADSKNIFMRIIRKFEAFTPVLLPPLILMTALTTPPKEKNEKNKNVSDFVKDNCGMLTFISILPHTIEECIANIKGVKIAKQSGLKGEMLNKVIKSNKYSSFSYCRGAIIASLSVFIVNKLHDFIHQKSNEYFDKKTI